jgi:putative heme-binding domain-containing protein
LLQPLAGEPTWTVRYEVLRFFRRAAGAAHPSHLAWLSRWSEGPADTKRINGWNGTYLALGGAYERAFQDFLLRLVREKGTRPAMEEESKFEGIIATEPARTDVEKAAIAARVAAVKKLIADAGARTTNDGRELVQSFCLACHRIADKGVSLAPPLDGSAARDVDALITAILEPDAAVETVFRLYRVETNDGGKLEGFRKSADAKEITLMFMGGTTQTVPVAGVKNAGYVQGKSAMPPLGAGMSDQQVADIVRYLRTVK